LSSLEGAFKSNDSPKVFRDAAALVGMQSLLQYLHAIRTCKSRQSPGRKHLYALLRWPVPHRPQASYFSAEIENLFALLT
jgi:hypothetical protein